MSRRVFVNLMTFLVASVLMVGWAVSNIVSVEQLEKPYPLSVQLANSFGVGANAEVTYLGVSYGAVDSVERVPGGVVLRLKIERGKEIPAGSTAHVLRKSVIGEPYIDFAPPPGYTGEGAAYRPGEQVPKERTTIPLEFSELLRSADALLASVPPEDLSTLLHEGSVALQGRTESLRALADAGDRLSGALAARTEALDRLATNGTRVTDVVADHRNSLGQSLRDLRQLADTLKSASGDTTVLLDKGSQLVTQVADIVAKHKGNLDCDLKTLELVTDIANTDRRIKGLATLLDLGPQAFGQVWDATDVEDGQRWIRVGAVFPEERPLQYTPPKDLPAVPAVGPCTSSLRPVSVAGGSVVPTAQPSTGGLAATGGTPTAVLGAALLLTALVARRVRLRSPR
ncbi:MAG TPA: MCE family protein [Acidimicrobiales bacterium]|nr:MCE family protein [Acidimicrobiales bacterium]